MSNDDPVPPTSKEESPVVFNLRQIAASNIARWDIRNHIAAAADEIERLTRELAAERALRIEAERYAEGREEHNITLAKGGEIITAERDRLREALSDFAAMPCETIGIEDIEPGCCRTCRARALLSGEPNAAPETVANLGMDTPWPLSDVLAKLIEASDHLLYHRGCDTHGHEEFQTAARYGRGYLEQLRSPLKAGEKS